jgi:hypothetical protein
MRAGRLTASGVLVATLVTGPLGPQARADDRAGAFVDPAGNPTAFATDTSEGQAESTASGGGVSNCALNVWIEDDTEFHVYDTDGTPVHSSTGRWLMRTCQREGEGGIAAVDTAVIPEGEPVDPAALALQALESVTVPEPVIGTSPAAGDLVVHVPTWLWVSGGWWEPYSGTATAGRVSSTVTVEPVRALWSTGDGSRVSCAGPGIEWAPGMPEDATDCSYTYRSSSDAEPGGTFTLSVTVELDVAWSSTTGASGALPAMSRTARQTVRVGEIQAIKTE